MREVWKDIEGYNGVYMVSNNGNVVSKNFNNTGIEKKLKALLRGGYLYVDLCKNGIKKKLVIHRLVAKAFIENNENKPQVNHKNGNKTDNNVNNLEWCNASENNIHAFKIGLNKISDKCKAVNRERVRLSTKRVYQYTIDGIFVSEHVSQHDAAKAIGVFQQNISKCINGKYKTCGGFIWKNEFIANAN